MKEEVEQDDYKLPLQSIKSILVDYQLNIDEAKFRYKIIKNDIKNIAIISLFNKIIISTGFLNWASENNNKHIKPILAHEVSHKNRFYKFWSEIIFLNILLLMISNIFIIIISALLLSYEKVFFTQILSFLMQFITYFSVYIVIFWLMRRNEYFADKGSVELGNLPNDMIKALLIIVEINEEDIVTPSKIKELFNIHPDIGYRIKKLRLLG